MVYIHQHKRIRASREDLEPYPHHKRFFKILDAIVYAVAIIGPLTVLPQILKIWLDKQVDGVSIISWSSFVLLKLPLVVYAFAHKDPRLTIMYSLFLLLDLTVVIGILIFG